MARKKNTIPEKTPKKEKEKRKGENAGMVREQ